MVETPPLHAGPGRSRALVGLAVLLATTSLALPSVPARAQDDPLTLAFYAPNLFFSDSVARAGFVRSIAAQLESELGIDVEGVNLSSPEGLDRADFAIVDGIVYAARPRGEPIGAAEGASGREAPLALIVTSSGPSRLADLAGRTLLLPRGSERLEDFVTARVLHGEMRASEFFGAIEYASNVESALASVLSGDADVTLAFAEYGSRSGLRVLGRYDEAPLPVVVQLNGDLDPELARRVAEALRRTSGTGEIRGFTTFDDGVVRTFGRRSTREREMPQPLMTRARNVTLDPGDIGLPDVQEPLLLGSPVELLRLPEMEEP
jgi:ABC-type phosphate/phosphonate transport system substrate-binding protein